METKPREHRRPLAEGPPGFEAQRAAENPENFLPTKAERIVTTQVILACFLGLRWIMRQRITRGKLVT